MNVPVIDGILDIGGKVIDKIWPDPAEAAKAKAQLIEMQQRGEFPEGWEVMDVPGRSYIMVHPGNWPENFEGCIGVGTDYMILSGRNAVSNSREAFRQFMQALSGMDAWDLVITGYHMEYP